MFKEKDCIKHNHYGICQIDAIVDRKMSNGVKKQFYVMHTLQGIKTKIQSPVDNKDILPVTSLETIDELLENIETLPDMWIEENRKRTMQYQDILVNGDVFDLTSVIRTLHKKREEKRSEGKVLSTSDAKIMEQAETKLNNELSFQLKIEPEKVNEYIAKKIKNAK